MKQQAMITGASEGIGRALAQRLAARGWTLTLVARSASRLRALAKALPGRHHVCVADLTTSAGLTLAREVLRRRTIHLLINNAGITHYGAFSELPLEQHQEVLGLNCHAPLLLAHAFLARASAGCALINVSSMLAHMPQPTSSVYAASKAFVSSLSESLWYENKHKGIYVMALHPGITQGTEFRRRGGGAPTSAPWALSADAVARCALDALDKRERCSVVCGLTNKWMALGVRLMPRRSLVCLLGRGRSRQLHQAAADKPLHVAHRTRSARSRNLA